MFKQLSSALILISIGFSSTLWAKDSKAKTTAVVPTESYGHHFSGLQGLYNLGMVRGALNLGAQIDKPADGYDLGGYLFLQQSKDKSGNTIVNQVTSLGGQIKVHLVQSGQVDAYLAPGVGIHMIKDVADGANSKSDVSTIGPTLRIGAMMQTTPTMKMGLERFEIWNWLDDKAAGTYEAYSLVMAIAF